MTKLQLVTPEHKPPKKKRTLSVQLEEALQRISELEDKLENERRRADEAIDRYDRLEDEFNEENDLRLSAESNNEDIRYYLEAIETCKWRHDLGIPGMLEEIERHQTEMEKCV